MKDKKLQVFVSSTYDDLKEERQAAVEAILSSGNIPAGMELFAAGDESQMTVIERWIDESDIYLLILGGRYGSIEPKTGKSYTQLEFEYAVSKKIPLFSVVISEKALDEKLKTLGRTAFEDKNPKLLEDFKSLVKSNIVKFWDDKKDIKIAVGDTISDFAYRKELIGWVRGDKSIDTGFLAEEIARLTKENFTLREKLINTDNSVQTMYSGLEYSQLTELLLDETIGNENVADSLFEYFLTFGEKLATQYRPKSQWDDEAMKKLVKYNLVEIANFGHQYDTYRFTGDGHKYFLKALILSKRRNIE
jgi:hypothetical protein